MVAAVIRFLPDRLEVGASDRFFTSAFADTANVSEDGQCFLLFVGANETKENGLPLTVVLNWSEELKQRVPTR